MVNTFEKSKKYIDIMKTIDSFHGEYKFLSNFYMCTIFHNGIAFPSVEHAFVASKSNDMQFWNTIRSTSQPGKAKRLGRRIQLIDNWDEIKDSIMETLLKTKFSYPMLRRKLLSTEDSILIEGNNWHDQYWGDCRCDRHIHILGKNILGKLLMKIRSEL